MLEARQKFTNEKRLLALILAVGAALRFWHLAWSLPDMYEEAYPFAIAWKFWQWGSPGIAFDPGFFHYPALTFYIQFVLQGIHYLVGHFSGVYADLAAFQKAYEHDPTVFIAIARGASAFFDLGSIVLMYVIVSRWFGRPAALIAALFLALNPLLIMEAQLVNVDTPMTFFALLTFFFLTRLYDVPEGRWYLLTGASIGLAAATKYTGALLVVPLAVTHFWRAKEMRGIGPFMLSLGAAALLFLFLNPYILLHSEKFLADFSYEQRHMATGHLGVDAARNSLVYYLVDALPRILGWPLLLAVVAGFGFAAAQKEHRMAVVALFPATLLAVIGTWEMRADRYLLPLLPFLMIAGAYGAEEISRRLGSLAASSGVVRTATLAVVLIAIVALPVSSVLSYHRALGTPDTRTQAKEWILRSLPGRATIVTGPFGIRLPEERFAMLLIPFSPTGSEAFAPFYAPEWYEDFDLLVASDYDYGRFSLEPDRYKDLLGQYARLRSEWRLAAEFAPKEGQNGPTIWLFRPPGRPAEAFNASLLAPLRAIAETSFVVNFAEHLAASLFDKGSIVKAGQMAEFVLDLAPDHARLLNSFAWSLFKKGEYRQALALAERSLAADSTQAEMVGLRGSIGLRTGNEPRAEKDLLRAIRLNEKLEVPYLDLELYYRNRNDRVKQIAILRQYLAILAPGSDNARRTEAYLRQLVGP